MNRIGVLALVLVTGLAGCAPDDDACCDSDARCAAGALCFEGMCAPACDDVSQCREGEACLAGVCVEPLRQTGHCPFVEKREPRTPASDGGPSPRDAGSPDAGPAQPTCGDVFEPNNERSAARPLLEGTLSAAVCPAGDHDFYLVTVSETVLAELSLRLSFVHAEGDIDLEVLDAEGSRLAVSQSASDSEEIALPVSGPRQLYVHVYGFGQASNQYTLDVQLLPPAEECVDDGFEDNDSSQSPTLLSPADDVEAVFCAGDPDVYTTALSNAERGLAILSYERGDALSLQVREAGAGILGESATASGLELVSFTMPAGDVVNARVNGVNLQTQARPYLLGIRALDGSCGVDSHESNDVAAESTTILLLADDGVREGNGVLCERDVDVWRLLWTPGSDGIELELIAPEDIRAFVVRAADLSLIAHLGEDEPITLIPDVTVVSNEVLVYLVGAGEDAGYRLMGRAFYED